LAESIQVGRVILLYQVFEELRWDREPYKGYKRALQPHQRYPSEREQVLCSEFGARPELHHWFESEHDVADPWILSSALFLEKHGHNVLIVCDEGNKRHGIPDEARRLDLRVIRTPQFVTEHLLSLP
jgi:hypothetical protein